MDAVEIFDTKVTRLGNGLYGCRVINIDTQQPIVELRVTRTDISNAFFDMFRTLDKLGYPSPMAHASRHRGKGVSPTAKYIWY